MNETRRTITYVVAAVILAVVAWKLSPPVEISPKELEAAKIGTEFWPDFKDPNAPTSIRVVAFDEAKASHQSFGVKFENGKWTIPSHHNYPADGADRLAKTAASVMHIKREEIASDSDQNDEKLGVVDPLDDDRTKLKGRGKRITLSEGENTLVDLIIGKQVKDRPGFYYIRKPGDKMTFVAKVNIDLSTKFADWVETDLLKIDRNDLKEIVINDYSIDEANGRLVPGEISKLTHDKSSDPWKLDGLDDAKEELDTSKVTALVGALDDLRLVGVRPKPKGLRPDLTIDREFVTRQVDFDRLRFDMQSRGFILQPDRKNQLHIYSNEGELAAATSKGVVYSLQFGEIFSGDESEIEIGSAAEGEGDAKDKKEKKEDEDPDAKDKSKAKDAGKQPSRYLFVTTHFDEQYLGPPPEEPELSGDESGNAPKIKPKKSTKSKPEPDGDDEPSSSPKAKTPSQDEADEGEQKSANPEDECGPPSAADDKSDSAADDKEEKAANKPESDAPASKEETDDATGTKPDDENAKSEKPKTDGPMDDKPKKSEEDLKKEREAKRKKYEADLKAYDDKVAEGKKQVDELNARFGDWYYVISAENFNKLHLSRKELVKEKNKPAASSKSDGKEGQSATDEKPDAGADDPDEE